MFVVVAQTNKCVVTWVATLVSSMRRDVVLVLVFGFEETPTGPKSKTLISFPIAQSSSFFILLIKV